MDFITPLLHSIFTVFQPLLILIIKNNVILDYTFLLFTYLTLLHWTFLNGECIITYNYKKKQNPNYIPGQHLHSNEMSLVLNDYKYIIKFVIILTNILLMFGLYNLFNRNNISLFINCSFLILYEIYYFGLYFYTNHHKNKDFLLFQETIKKLILLWGVFFLYNLNI